MVKYKKYQSLDALTLVGHHSLVAVKPVEIQYACKAEKEGLIAESSYYSDLLQSVVYCSLSPHLKRMGIGIQPCRITNDKIYSNDSDWLDLEDSELCERLGVDGFIAVQAELPTLLGRKTSSVLNGCWLRCVGSYNFSLMIKVYDKSARIIVWKVYLQELLSPFRRIRHVISVLKDECKLLPYRQLVE
jgi:hypothetical protein